MPLVRKSAGVSGGAPPTAADVAANLASDSEDTRWLAARVAADFPELADPLAAALRSERSPRVREALFTALVRIGNAAGIAGVLPQLRADDANLRTGALDAMRIMIRTAPELLPALLQDTDVDIRILSCELVRSLPEEEATRLLCDLLQREPAVNVCAAAVEVLAEVGQQEALPVLAACARRFQQSPFLAFAIQVTAERIGAKPSARG